MLKQNDSILLVEDDETDITSIKRIFNHLKIKNPLHISTDGQQALLLLENLAEQTKIPKIILLDIDLPKMNGIDLLCKIRKRAHLKKIIVFILTSSNHEKDVENAYSLNAAGYILKPMDYYSLVQKMSQLSNYWHLIETPAWKM